MRNRRKRCTSYTSKGPPPPTPLNLSIDRFNPKATPIVDNHYPRLPGGAAIRDAQVITYVHATGATAAATRDRQVAGFMSKAGAEAYAIAIAAGATEEEVVRAAQDAAIAALQAQAGPTPRGRGGARMPVAH